jgi:pimeloyl-ACP methyl ester carboxylesterase
MQIIYISGKSGDASIGLGGWIKEQRPDRIGLSINNKFLALDYERQASTVSNLVKEFDNPDTLILANSYGAYLLLQAILEIGDIASRVILLSPVMGRGMLKTTMFMSRPPGEHKVVEAEKRGDVLAGMRVAVHVGEHDDSVNICDISRRLGIVDIHVVPTAGHNLPNVYVQKVISLHLA